MAPPPYGRFPQERPKKPKQTTRGNKDHPSPGPSPRGPSPSHRRLPEPSLRTLYRARPGRAARRGTSDRGTGRTRLWGPSEPPPLTEARGKGTLPATILAFASGMSSALGRVRTQVGTGGGQPPDRVEWTPGDALRGFGNLARFLSARRILSGAKDQRFTIVHFLTRAYRFATPFPGGKP